MRFHPGTRLQLKLQPCPHPWCWAPTPLVPPPGALPPAARTHHVPAALPAHRIVRGASNSLQESAMRCHPGHCTASHQLYKLHVTARTRLQLKLQPCLYHW